MFYLISRASRPKNTKAIVGSESVFFGQLDLNEYYNLHPRLSTLSPVHARRPQKKNCPRATKFSSC